MIVMPIVAGDSRRTGSRAGGAFLLAFFLVWSGTVRAESARLLIAWENQDASRGFVGVMSADAPWSDPVEIHELDPGLVLRRGPGVVYGLSRSAGSLVILDERTLALHRTISPLPCSEPRDVAPRDEGTFVVSCRDAASLLLLDAESGASSAFADLTVFADGDGLAEPEMMFVDGGRLLVQLQRIDRSPDAPPVPPTPMIAVVDLATGQLIDADPSTQAMDAIALAGTAPKMKMKRVPGTELLLVSASGAFHDAGGLEVIDLSALASLGLLEPETDGRIGADLGAIEPVGGDLGVLTYSTDIVQSSHMSPFSVSSGVPNGVPAYLNSIFYIVPELVYYEDERVVFAPEGEPPIENMGVRVIDPDTGEHQTENALQTFGRPTDLLLLPSGPTIPSVSTWGAASLAFALLCAASLLLRRRGGTPRAAVR